MNTFINLVKRSLVKGRTKGRVGASKGVGASVGALSLSVLNLRTEPWPASLSYSPVGSAGGLMQEFCQAQDLEAIAIEI